MEDKFDQKLFKMAEEEKPRLPETLAVRVEDALGSIPVKKKIYKMNLRKAVILAAAMVMLLSITAVASAGILRERMEAMNREKLEEYFVQICTKKIPHDTYNRHFFDSEKQRMEELGEKYEKEGRFPEGEITLIEAPEKYNGKNIAYYPEAGTFFFPEKEMSDEELLQIIDFRSKRDYSLQKMNDMIASGEAEMPKEAQEKGTPETITDSSILNSDAVWEPDQELTIAYTGDFTVTAMAAGKKHIYLGGWNAIHRMEIGQSNSEVFFDGFEGETMVTCLYVDQEENIYVAGSKMNMEEKVSIEDGEYVFPKASPVLWKLDSDGNLLKKIDLSAYDAKYGNWINRMAVDAQGRIYLRSTALHEASTILVVDEDGNQISLISSGDYQFHGMGGLDVGKDGKVYTLVITRKSKSDIRRMGIASINAEEGRLDEVYIGIMPEEAILINLLAPGSNTDFVFWGFDGVFNYNLGEQEAACKTPAYEMPCEVEGAKYCALPDGRILLAASTEYVEESYGGEFKRTMWKPQSAYFYYLSSVR